MIRKVLKMAKIYYTESIHIIEIPKYLPPNKLKYEIVFSKDYQPVTGDLSQGTKTPPIKIEHNQLTATLHLKVGNVEVRRSRLNLNEHIKTREISLKSTVSKTCEQPNTTCNFQLKVNIYSIDRVSHRANLLSLSEIEKLAQRENKTMGYFIHRRSDYVSTTNRTTVDLINDPSTVQNKYVKKAMEIFKRLSSQHSIYPRLVYRDLMKEVFEFFLVRSNDPDTVIKEISNTFGVNTDACYTSEIFVFYHIYEALIREKDTEPGYDKIQHFTYCVGKSYRSGTVATFAAQYGGEIADLLKGGSWQDTKDDMEANNLGEAYGVDLYKKYNPNQDIYRRRID